MLHEIWALSKKDIKQRYHQRYLRMAWAVLNPVIYTLILTLIFTRVARIGSEGLPYPLFVYCGLFPWIFASSCLTAACSSLIANRNLVTRLKITRIAIPLSCALTAAVDFLISILILSVALFYYQIHPDPWALLWIPPIFAVQILFVIGLGLFLSAANAYIRDVTNALPVLLQAGFILSPVFYSARELRDKWEFFYWLNPMAVVIDSYRKIMLHGMRPEIPDILVAFTISTVVFIAGALCFDKLERHMADFI